MEKETLETQMKPHLYFILPISLPNFSSLPFLSPSPLGSGRRARTGPAAAAGQAAAGQAATGRRRPDGGRSGRMLVSGFPFFFSSLKFHLFLIPRS